MGWAQQGARALAGAKVSSAAITSCLCFFLLSAQASSADPSQLASLTPQGSVANAAQAVAAEHVTWPTTGWRSSAPEAEGIDSGVLAAALEQIRARHIPIHSLLIERHGTIVLDSYFYPFADNEAHNVFSVTKSVTSMLVGIAMAEHRLADINAPVLSLLPLQISDEPRKAHITLANLLSMTSGLDCRPAGGLSLLQQMLRSRHLAAFMMNRQADAEPGTVFDYCGGNTEIVSAVLTRSTGSSAFEFARQRLFAPLGITRARWSTDADHVSHGWGDLELQPRDMAKLGYLWLHNGRWQDRQIIPADYLTQALTRHVNVQAGIDYGYGMWLYPGHTPVDFEANGSGGQRITVIPSLDTVEVMTGGGLDANVVAQMIAPAVRPDGVLPANPDSDIRLAALANDSALPAGRRGIVELPDSLPQPKPRPAAPSEALVAQTSPSAVPSGVVAIPRAKPLDTAAAEAVPVPQPKPAITVADNRLAVPIPRSKPKPALQIETAEAAIASVPGPARVAANLRAVH